MNPKDCITALKKVIQLDQTSTMNLTPMLWGGAGVGKSSIVAQVGAQLDFIVKDIRLSTLSPVDVRGIPYVEQQQALSFDALESVNKMLQSQQDDTTTSAAVQQHLQQLQQQLQTADINARFRFIPPEFMPTGDEKRPVLLFFDEINTSVPANQVVAYEIALDRKMGGHPLPAGTAVVMAGNRMKDRGATYEMPMPLANRLIHLEVTAEIDQFVEYGMQHAMHEGILAFLKTKPQMLEMTPTAGNWTFATPRTWEMCSEILKAAEAENSNEHDTKRLVNATIGAGAASEILSFIKLRTELPDLEHILNTGEQWTHDRRDILYFYVITLSNRLLHSIEHTPKAANDKIDNYINAIEILSTELQALAINCVITNKNVMLYMGRNRALMNSIRKVLK